MPVETILKALADLKPADLAGLSRDELAALAGAAWHLRALCQAELDEIGTREAVAAA